MADASARVNAYEMDAGKPKISPFMIDFARLYSSVPEEQEKPCYVLFEGTRYYGRDPTSLAQTIRSQIGRTTRYNTVNVPATKSAPRAVLNRSRNLIQSAPRTLSTSKTNTRKVRPGVVANTTVRRAGPMPISSPALLGQNSQGVRVLRPQT